MYFQTTFLLLLVTIALHDANGMPDRPRVKRAGGLVVAQAAGQVAQAGAPAVKSYSKAVDLGVSELGSLFESYFENEGLICHWNDWQARDQRARLEKTFDNCRFSRAKRTFGVVNGRWYCTMTKAGCSAKGHNLD